MAGCITSRDVDALIARTEYNAHLRLRAKDLLIEELRAALAAWVAYHDSLRGVAKSRRQRTLGRAARLMTDRALE